LRRYAEELARFVLRLLGFKIPDRPKEFPPGMGPPGMGGGMMVWPLYKLNPVQLTRSLRKRLVSAWFQPLNL
jgi:hypothetical protein